MRILFLDEEFPFPLTSGKRIRSFSLVSRLARMCDVEYLAFCDESNEQAARKLESCGIVPHPVRVVLPRKSGPGFYWRLFSNLFSSDPYSVSNHYHPAFAERLQELLALHRYDLLVCEWTPYAKYVRELAGVPRIVATHNMEHQIWQRMRDTETNLVRRLYIALQAIKWWRFEGGVFSWIDGASVVSAEDAATIRGMNGDLPVAIVENGVDLEVFRPQEETEESQDIVFVGSMDWRPNQDAVRFFVAEIWPRVKSRLPAARFVVIGRKPSAEIRALTAVDGVVVTGTVPDVVPHLAQAKVVVVPLRVGGGSRLKILEAFAMAKTVVSTSIGAEGLLVEDGQHLVLADEPAAFADAVVRLCEDQDRRAELGQAGLELVRQHYGWDPLAMNLYRFLESAAR